METELFANPKDKLIVGILQIAPVWLNRNATIDKIIQFTMKKKNLSSPPLITNALELNGKTSILPDIMPGLM